MVELEFRNVGFWGEGKTGVLWEKPLGAKERTDNKLNPQLWHRCWDLNPGHIGGRRVLSPLHNPCSTMPPLFKEKKLNWTLPCNLHLQSYSQTKKTLNPELVISGIFIVFWPIIAKIRTHKQATKPLCDMYM